MKPQNSLILVEYKQETEKKTEAGIYVPPTAENNAIGFLRMGTVIAVNRKEETEEQDIKPGDKVYFNKNAITTIPTEKDNVLVRKEDIYLVLQILISGAGYTLDACGATQKVAMKQASPSGEGHHGSITKKESMTEKSCSLMLRNVTILLSFIDNRQRTLYNQ